MAALSFILTSSEQSHHAYWSSRSDICSGGKGTAQGKGKNQTKTAGGKRCLLAKEVVRIVSGGYLLLPSNTYLCTAAGSVDPTNNERPSATCYETHRHVHLPGKSPPHRLSSSLFL